MPAGAGGAGPGSLARFGALLRLPDFRRLLTVRLTGQASDGVFQGALVGYVLFSPERQADALSAALAFAVLLLPYSVLGPFAGVLLDHWRRRQVLVRANAVRAALLAVAALAAVRPEPAATAVLLLGLAAVSVNRFILTALGASLPRVVDGDQLVLGNAVSPTLGTAATALGAATAVALRPLLERGSTDRADAILLLAAGVGMLAAGLLALRLDADRLGPDPDQRRRSTLTDVADLPRELVEGLRLLAARPRAVDALGVVAVHRVVFAAFSVQSLVLFRQVYHPPDDPQAALGALGLVVVGVGAGALTAAVLTPGVVRRQGVRRWVVGLLVAGAAALLALGPVTLEPATLALGVSLGFAGQGVKVSADSIVQAETDDDFRGRAFSVYDVVFNAVFVGAGVVVALALPADGRAPWLPVLLAGLYLVAAAGYARRPQAQTSLT